MSARDFIVKTSGKHVVYHGNRPLVGSHPTREAAQAHLDAVIKGRVVPQYEATLELPDLTKESDTPPPTGGKRTTKRSLINRTKSYHPDRK